MKYGSISADFCLVQTKIFLFKTASHLIHNRFRTVGHFFFEGILSYGKKKNGRMCVIYCISDIWNCCSKKHVNTVRCIRLFFNKGLRMWPLIFPWSEILCFDLFCFPPLKISLTWCRFTCDSESKLSPQLTLLSQVAHSVFKCVTWFALYFCESETSHSIRTISLCIQDPPFIY